MSSDQQPRGWRGPRPSTVVWGVLVMAAGALLLSVAAGVPIDLGLAAILGLAGVGVALLISALIGAARRRP